MWLSTHEFLAGEEFEDAGLGFQYLMTLNVGFEKVRVDHGAYGGRFFPGHNGG